MEALRSLMQIVDSHAESIPEGDYLRMCNNLKEIHDTIPKHDDPPVSDFRMPVQSIPFSVRVPENDEDEEYVSIHEEWVYCNNCIQELDRRRDEIIRERNKLKVIKNVTKKIKNDAIRNAAFQNFGGDTNIKTIDDLRSNGLNILDEKEFYRAYILLRNERTRDNLVMFAERELEISDRIEEFGSRINFLDHTYGPIQ